MNTNWSTYIQKIETLNRSRLLRFNDYNKNIFKKYFGIKNGLKILELGCGTGILSYKLSNWYQNAIITGIDRDSNFVKFCKEKYANNKRIQFIETDVESLFFEKESFDVTISHTVSEHIDPKIFFSEQYRVLKNKGICLMLSSRTKNSINIIDNITNSYSEFEKRMWEKAKRYYEIIHEKYPVCQFPRSEQEYPILMEEHGFKNISTDYIAINLTPDNNRTENIGKSIIEDNYRSTLEQIDFLKEIIPDYNKVFTKTEIKQWKNEITKKYNERLNKFEKEEKLWEVNVSIIMILRGEKQLKKQD